MARGMEWDFSSIEEGLSKSFNEAFDKAKKNAGQTVDVFIADLAGMIQKAMYSPRLATAIKGSSEQMQALIEAATRFDKYKSEGNAKGLLEIVDIIKTISGDFSNIDTTDAQKSMENIGVVLGALATKTKTSAADVETAMDAIRRAIAKAPSYEFGYNRSSVMNLGLLGRNMAGTSFARDITDLETEHARLESDYQQLLSSIGDNSAEAINEMHDRLNSIIKKSVEEFRTYLKAVNIDESYGNIYEYIENIQNGSMSVNEAITAVKSFYPEAVSGLNGESSGIGAVVTQLVADLKQAVVEMREVVTSFKETVATGFSSKPDSGVKEAVNEIKNGTDKAKESVEKLHEAAKVVDAPNLLDMADDADKLAESSKEASVEMEKVSESSDVSSQGVKEAAEDLSKMAESGEKAKASLENVGAELNETPAQITNESNKLEQASGKIEESAQKLSSAGKEMKPSLDGMTEKAKEINRVLEEAAEHEKATAGAMNGGGNPQEPPYYNSLTERIEALKLLRTELNEARQQIFSSDNISFDDLDKLEERFVRISAELEDAFKQMKEPLDEDTAWIEIKQQNDLIALIRDRIRAEKDYINEQRQEVALNTDLAATMRSEKQKADIQTLITLYKNLREAIKNTGLDENPTGAYALGKIEGQIRSLTATMSERGNLSADVVDNIIKKSDEAYSNLKKIGERFENDTFFSDDASSLKAINERANAIKAVERETRALYNLYEKNKGKTNGDSFVVKDDMVKSYNELTNAINQAKSASGQQQQDLLKNLMASGGALDAYRSKVEGYVAAVDKSQEASIDALKKRKDELVAAQKQISASGLGDTFLPGTNITVLEGVQAEIDEVTKTIHGARNMAVDDLEAIAAAGTDSAKVFTDIAKTMSTDTWTSDNLNSKRSQIELAQGLKNANNEAIKLKASFNGLTDLNKDTETFERLWNEVAIAIKQAEAATGDEKAQLLETLNAVSLNKFGIFVNETIKHSQEEAYDGSTKALAEYRSELQSFQTTVSNLASGVKGLAYSPEEAKEVAERYRAEIAYINELKQRKGETIKQQEEHLTELDKDVTQLREEAEVAKVTVATQQQRAEALERVKRALLDIANIDYTKNDAPGKYAGLLSQDPTSMLKGYEELLKGKDTFSTASLEHLNTILKNIGDGAKDANSKFGDLSTTVDRVTKRIIGWEAAIRVFQYAKRWLKDIYENVKAVDSAMVELKKVTNETTRGYEAFYRKAVTAAKTVGATLSDTINATADFARLGYSIGDASELAQAALVYKNVGDGIDNINEATTSIISTMKAFGVEAENAMTIVDKFNEVGNNYAISSVGIGEALKRSAAALAGSGNTIEESIGLIVGMNNVIQDPEKVGTALKTTSMFLRAAKTELEDSGESAEGCAESVSKLRTEMLALTGVDIMLDNNTFKSTFQVYKELAEVWDDLTDVTRANVTNLLGGKRQANNIQALITNFKDAERAAETAANSSGSAMRENEAVLDSIQGKLTILKGTWEAFSEAILDDGLVKFILDLANGFGEVGTAIADVAGSAPAIMGLLNGVVAIGTKGQGNLWDVVAGIGQAVGIGKAEKYMGGQNGAPIFSMAEINVLKKYNEMVAKGAGNTKILKNMTAGMRKEVYDTAVQFKGGTDNLKQFGINVQVLETRSKIAAVAIGTLKAVASSLASMGIGMAVGAIVNGITAAIKSVAETRKRAFEETQRAKEQWEQDSEEIEEKQKALAGIADEYNELVKGVDANGNNKWLSNEQYERFLELSQEIASIAPDVVAGYNDRKEAIIDYKDAVDDANESLERNNRLARDKYLSGYDYEVAFDEINKKIDRDDKTNEIGYSELESLGTKVGFLQSWTDGFESGKSIAAAVSQDLQEFMLSVGNSNIAIKGYDLDESAPEMIVDMFNKIRDASYNGSKEAVIALYENKDEYLAAYKDYIESVADPEAASSYYTIAQEAMRDISTVYSDIITVVNDNTKFLTETLRSDVPEIMDSLTFEGEQVLRTIIRDRLKINTDMTKGEAKQMAFDLATSLATIYSSEEYKALKKQAKELADGSQDYDAYNESVKSFGETLAANGVASDVIDAVTNSLSMQNEEVLTAADSYEMLTNNLKSYKEVLESISAISDVLSKAQSDMEKYGKLTGDTIASIMTWAEENGKDPWEYLYFDGNTVKANLEGLQAAIDETKQVEIDNNKKAKEFAEDRIAELEKEIQGYDELEARKARSYKQSKQTRVETEVPKRPERESAIPGRVAVAESQRLKELRKTRKELQDEYYSLQSVDGTLTAADQERLKDLEVRIKAYNAQIKAIESSDHVEPPTKTLVSNATGYEGSDPRIRNAESEIERYKAGIEEADKNIALLNADTDATADSTKLLANAFKDLSTGINPLQDAGKVAKSAKEEFEKWGAISEDTKKSLTEVFGEDVVAAVTKDGGFNATLLNSYVKLLINGRIEAGETREEWLKLWDTLFNGEEEKKDNTLKDIISDVSKIGDLITGIEKDIADDGFISLDTFEDILNRYGDAWTDYVEITEDGLKMSDGWRDAILESQNEAITAAVDAGEITLEDAEKLRTIIKGLYESDKASTQFEGFKDALKDINDLNNLLGSIEEDMAENDGYVSYDTFSDILDRYGEEWREYVDITEDGFKMSEGWKDKMIANQTDAINELVEQGVLSAKEAERVIGLIKSTYEAGAEDVNFYDALIGGNPSDAMSKMDSFIDLMKKAKEEVDEYGIVSRETADAFKELMTDDQYAQFFTEDADGIHMNTDALKEWVMAGINASGASEELKQQWREMAETLGLLTDELADYKDLLSNISSTGSIYQTINGELANGGVNSLDTVMSFINLAGENWRDFVDITEEGFTIRIDDFVASMHDSIDSFASLNNLTKEETAALHSYADASLVASDATDDMNKAFDGLTSIMSTAEKLGTILANPMEDVEQTVSDLISIFGEEGAKQYYEIDDKGTITIHTNLIEDMIDSYVEANGVVGILFGNIVKRSRQATEPLRQFTELMGNVSSASSLMKTAQEEYAESGTNSISTLQSLISLVGEDWQKYAIFSASGLAIDTEALKTWTNEQIEAMGLTQEQTEWLKKQAEAEIELAEATDKAAAANEKITGVMSNISGMADHAEVTYDTFKKLMDIDVRYIDALEMVNGQMTLNKDKYYEISDAILQTTKAEMLAEAQAIRINKDYVEMGQRLDDLSDKEREWYNKQTSLIRGYEMLANSIDSATSAINKFKNANKGTNAENYDALREAQEIINNVLYDTENKSGLFEHYGNEQFRYAMEIFFDPEIDVNSDAFKEMWAKVQRYLEPDNAGMYNFQQDLIDIGAILGDPDGDGLGDFTNFNMSLEELAKNLGISTEACIAFLQQYQEFYGEDLTFKTDDGEVKDLTTAISDYEDNADSAATKTETLGDKLDTLDGKIEGLNGKQISIDTSPAWRAVNDLVEKVKELARYLRSLSEIKINIPNGGNDGGGNDGGGNDGSKNGGASVSGTTGAKGGKTLVGELGPEMVVDPRTNRYYTVGNRGPEFVNLPKGAVVFNAKQTADLLKSGMADTIGTALLSGNALISGTTASTIKKEAKSVGSQVASAVENALSGIMTLQPNSDAPQKEKDPDLTLRQKPISNPGKKKKSSGNKKKKDKKDKDDDGSKFQKIIDNLDKAIAKTDHIIKHYEQMFIEAERALNFSDDDGMKEALEGQINTYKEQMEAAQKAIDKLKKKGAKDSDEELQKAEEAYWAAYNSMIEAGDKLRNLFVDGLNTQIDDLQKSVSSLKTAAQEYGETGAISLDTFQDILSNGVQYLALLKDENGQYVINEESISKMVQAKKNQLAVEQALSYLSSVKEALENGETNRLKNLVSANYEVSNSTWSVVNAKLAELKALGLSDEEYNQVAKNIEALKAITNTVSDDIVNDAKSQKEKFDNAKESIGDILDEVKKLVKYENEKHIEAINKQIEAYQKIIDLKKESLDLNKEEEDHQKTLAEKTQEIAKIQAKIDQLALDDSRAAQAERAKLMEDLAEKQKDLADYQSDYAYDKQVEALDKAAEEYEKSRQDELDALENELSSEEKLMRKTKERMSGDWNELFNDLLAYNYDAGDITQADLIEKWEAATKIVKEYGSYLEAYKQLIEDTKEDGEDPNYVVVAPKNPTKKPVTPTKPAPRTGEPDAWIEPPSFNGKRPAGVAPDSEKAPGIPVPIGDKGGKVVLGEPGEATKPGEPKMGIFAEDILYETTSIAEYLMSKGKLTSDLETMTKAFESGLTNVGEAALKELGETIKEVSSNVINFSPVISVQIDGSEIDTEEAGRQVANVALQQLYDAFGRKGIEPSALALL